MAGPVQSILDLVPRGHSKSKIIERDGLIALTTN